MSHSEKLGGTSTLQSSQASLDNVILPLGPAQHIVFALDSQY